MKRLNKGILCSTLLVLLAGTVAGIAHAERTQAEDTASVEKSSLRVGRQYFISGNELNVRSSNSTNAGNIVGKLALNDVVEVYDLLNAGTPLVQVKIIKSNVRNDGSANYYVSKDYLSERSLSVASSAKYFVVQNVATEKTRVYERCTTSPGCPHTLVMETEMVVGRPEEGTDKDKDAFKTWLGHAKISEWIKFYQDGAGHYPHWYKAGQDPKTIPGPISSSFSPTLGSRKWMTRGKDGETIYGAFGWYAAKVTPADDRDGMNYQWMHGTMGWGKDGPLAIRMTRGFMLNMVSNPGSSGCTRLENRAIAYLRSLLPVGTDIYRVYAKEASRNLGRYAAVQNNPGQWNYILTTLEAQRSGGLEADAQVVSRKGVSASNILEQGTYDVDRYPTVTALNYNENPSSGKTGDRYKIDSGLKKDAANSNFQGYFLVDEGRFVNYKHPSYQATRGRVKTSGLPDFRNNVPEFLTAAPGPVSAPEVNYRK